MQYRFDERVDSTIQKSVKQALRFYRERRKAVPEGTMAQRPPSFEEFVRAIHESIESSKIGDKSRLRTPTLRDLFERTWSQKLRNYSTQRLFREAYEALIRRF